MLFDKNHILFFVLAFIFIAVMEIIAFFVVKNQNKKQIVLRIAAILTVVLHFSSLYVDYFKTGTAQVENTMLLPIYPCNIAMWLLLIVSFMKNKEGKVYKILAEFAFYLGIVGGVIGIVFNEIYATNPNLADWDVLKGLLSHTTMLFGTIYLLVGGFIKIRVRNTFSVFCGMLFMLVDGGIIIGLHRAFNLNPPNAMYLLEAPFANMPWINTWTIGIAAVLLTFAISAIFEQCALKREDRWYSNMRLFKGGKKD